MYYVYVLKSQKRNILYIGFSADLRQGIDQHNRGENQSTKSGTPWKLIYYESYLSSKDAHKRELQLKQYSSAYGFLKRRIADSITRA
jgi:putative endonuclease